jgi:hypothetical protein
MSIISNLFSNLDDLTKKKSIIDNPTDCETNKNVVTKKYSPSLNQGKAFNKFQNKITNNLEKKAERLSLKEGFQSQGLQQNGLTMQTKKVIDTNDYASQQQVLANLKSEYDSTLAEYQSVSNQTQNITSNYINRSSSSNPYLGKVIQLQGGALFYVTNQGVAKQFDNMEIYTAVSGTNGFPPQGQFTAVSIPWSSTYNTPGATIPTNPPLITGTPIQIGQSVGNEGANVYVNKMISNPTTSYQGCYADNASPPSTMTFIGGSPPPPNTVSIVNGNFSASQINPNTYIGYWGTNNVPGWYFNAMLLNSYQKSSYPIPYPGGNQCVSIYYNQYIYQLITLPAGTYSLSFYLCGSNIGSGGNEIGIGIGSTTSPQTQANQNFYETPPVNVWTQYTVNFTITVSGPFQITFWGFNNGLYSALANVSLTSSGANTSAGTYTYSMCEQAAINGGYNYFALQDVNTDSSQGYCAVSNDGIAPTQNGISNVVSGQTALWSSNTAGNSGAYASFVNGSLKVLNSSGAAIFSTPNGNTAPSNYIGCYGDVGGTGRAMTNTISSSGQLLPATGPYSWSFGVQQCQQAAQQNNMSYFGLQDVNSEGQAVCFTSNNLSQSQQYGIATNCSQLSDGSWTGGGGSNAIYSTSTPSNSYYVVLQSGDGNMCINMGSGINDYQGNIWCSDTIGQQQQGNPLMVAANNKFGQIWMPSGSALAPGEYLSSENGNLVLIMQSDGNLVLYTYQLAENCQKMADGNTGGGVGANALYQLNAVGKSSLMSMLGFVDEDSLIYTYPESNSQFSSQYTQFTGNSSGNDIQGASFGSATVDQCTTTCNSNAQCAGFVFDNVNNICYPKNSGIYPNSSINVDEINTTYVRNKVPASPPIGVPNTTNNIDTVLYGNYINGGQIQNKYGLSSLTTTQRQQLSQLQTKLDLLSSQITSFTTNFENGADTAQNQAKKNVEGIQDYLTGLDKTNVKVKNFDTTFERVLTDSDINILKDNYNYLFWSILAAGTVIVSMNVLKGQPQ